MSEIRTQDEYSRIEKNGFELPYMVEVARGNQQLVFYGSEHTSDPEHPQFADISRRWRAFTDRALQPIALVEGRFDEVAEDQTKDGEQSVIAGGEAQFLVHLARRDGVEVVSPEPDRQEEANQLAEEFGRETVIFYYFIRQLEFWHRMTEKPDMQAEAAKMLALMEASVQWDDVSFSVQNMEAVHASTFGKTLGWNDEEWLYELITPAETSHITNQLARRSGELRDEHILEQLKRYWAEGRSIFAVFGSAHAIRLEPALRSLGTNN